MKTNDSKFMVWLALAILLAGLAPVFLYHPTPGTAPEVTAAAAGDSVAAGKCLTLEMRQMSPVKQWLAVITAFGIKPIYLILSIIWVVWLWRERAPDLVALRWGVIIFWLGEQACTVNYQFYHGLSDAWEYLHNYGMVVGFSFVAYAVLEGFDVRVLKLSAPRERCAALNLCKTCVKYSPVPCGLQLVFKFLIPATIVVATMPLAAAIKHVSYNVKIMDVTANYSLMLSSQLFETRYCPVLALILLTASWLVMLFKRTDPVPLAKLLFAGALGPLGFAFMRLFLAAAFAEDLFWYVVWEEWTELLFIAAVGVILWLFRVTLFAKPAATEDIPAASAA